MALWLSCVLAGMCLCLLLCVLCRSLLIGVRSSQPDRTGTPTLPLMPDMSNGRWRAMLARRLIQAGMGQRWTVQRWLVRQSCLTLFMVISALGAAILGKLPLLTTVLLVVSVIVLTTVVSLVWLSARVRERQRLLLCQLPFFLDLLTLCVEAGQSLQSALQQAAQYGPDGALKQELSHVLAQLRTGLARADAFDALYVRSGVPALAQFALSLRQSDQFGISLGAVLRAQAAQQRDARFTRAEKLALQAPVKMLFPLVCCIFPCTFLILGFPLLTSFLHLLN